MRSHMSLRSPHFTPQETFDFIVQIILESEDLLLNPTLSKTYTEEFGQYKGISRILVRKFRVYYEHIENDIVVLAIKFPGEI